MARIVDSSGSARSPNYTVFWSNDLHHGLVIDGRLDIHNPFA
jgi:predicted nucleic acid-binding protein